MAENLNFIQGRKEQYNPSEMQGGLFFSKDSKEILLNGDSYGNATPADEEDITAESGNLKLKDRSYDEASFSGKGYKILRKNIVEGKNILTQDRINEPNTIYEIRYDFDLNGATINIPEGCALKFDGGSLNNGSLKLVNTLLSGLPVINTDIVNNSTILNETLNIVWFGAKLNDIGFDNSVVISKLHNLSGSHKILIPSGTLYMSSCKMPPMSEIIGNGNSTKLKAIGSGKNYEYNGYNVSNCFLAIFQPYQIIRDLTIDGGYNEGYNNVGLGLYQTAFLNNVFNVTFTNCSEGCIHININGGKVHIDNCKFLCAGPEYCIKITGLLDSISISRCNFEGWDTNYNMNTDCIRYELNNITNNNINSKFISNNNRFESIKVNSIYNLPYSYSLEINNNYYLITTTIKYAYILENIRSRGSISNDIFSDGSVVTNPYIISNNNLRESLCVNGTSFSINSSIVGYLDNQEFISLYNTDGPPLVIFYSNGNIRSIPRGTEEQYRNFGDYVSIGGILFTYNGRNRRITTVTDSTALELGGTNLTKVFHGSRIGDIDPLLEYSGSTQWRPTSVNVGHRYFDTTLNKPVWWNGTSWIDPTENISWALIE